MSLSREFIADGLEREGCRWVPHPLVEEIALQLRRVMRSETVVRTSAVPEAPVDDPDPTDRRISENAAKKKAYGHGRTSGDR